MTSDPEMTFEEFTENEMNSYCSSGSGSSSAIPLPDPSIEFTLNDIKSNIDYINEEVGAWIEEHGYFDMLTHPIFASLQKITKQTNSKKKKKRH